MSERDKGDSEFRAAIIVPRAVRREQERVEILASVIGTDKEIIDEAIGALEEQIGSPVLRLTSDQARMERNRFYFSSSTWSAPWEPTGPNASYKARLN